MGCRSIPAANEVQKTEWQSRSLSVISLLQGIVRSWKFRAIVLSSWLGYWILYAFSGGMFFYYPNFDLTPYIKDLPNPEFVSNGPYFSGLLWWPNGHLQVNLLYGPFIFSLILSTLFSLNAVLTVFSIRLVHFSGGMGSVGTLALIPALFSGGCCSVPLGLTVISLIAPTAGLATLVYGYPFLINLAFVILLSLSLVYVGKRLARSCAIPSNRNEVSERES